MDVKKVVLEVAEEILGLEQEDMLDNMDMDLWDEGLLDSVGFAAMITHIEEHLHITIDMQELNPENSSTLNDIIATIEKKLI